MCTNDPYLDLWVINDKDINARKGKCIATHHKIIERQVEIDKFSGQR